MYRIPNEPFSLVGVDGNAFFIMGYVQTAMKTAKMSKSEIDEYLENAMKYDYNHLLRVSMETLDKCNEVLGLE